MKAIPEHGPCFVCGTENPHSIGMQWYLTDDGVITGTITLSEAQQGPPNHAHGGASTALLDEAMGAAVWWSGHRVLAVNLNVDFKHPVPLGEEIIVKGWVEKQDGKKVFVRGELRRSDDRVAVASTGIFVQAPPEMFGEDFDLW